MKKLSDKQIERLKHYYKAFKKELTLYDMDINTFKTILNMGCYDPTQTLKFDGKEWTLKDYLNHAEEIYKQTFYAK
jgi:hypothetical protein